MKQTYEEFLNSKLFNIEDAGFDIDRNNIDNRLFDFQKDIVKWALKRGKSAIFAGTGLGKTMMQLEWSRQVCNYTGGNVLILAPLAVASQTVREGKKIDCDVTLVRDDKDIAEGINIANYEILHKLDLSKFVGIVLDESSILKSFTGKVRTMIIDSFKYTSYKLACTATPAPNDYMELGNHSEFLNIMSRTEMLSMFFIHDGGETSKWRLKGHARNKFWEWVSSWSVMIRKPSDLGYDDGKYNLPPLNMNEVIVQSDNTKGFLISMRANTLSERQKARRETIEQRVQRASEIVNNTTGPFLVWCDLNAESELLAKLIPDAVEVKGSDKPDHKEKAMIDFAEGRVRVLITKPSIAGFGMNWQHCSNMCFVGLSDSYEKIYQAVRRCYRFGQESEVNAHLIISDREGSVLDNIKRKESDFEAMIDGMIQFTSSINKSNIKSASVEKTEYNPKVKMILPAFLTNQGGL